MKSVHFRDSVISIIEEYAKEHEINFNKAVNDIISEHVKIEELQNQIIRLEAELQKEKNNKEVLMKNITDRFDRMELLLSNDPRTRIG